MRPSPTVGPCASLPARARAPRPSASRRRRRCQISPQAAAVAGRQRVPRRASMPAARAPDQPAAAGTRCRRNPGSGRCARTPGRNSPISPPARCRRRAPDWLRPRPRRRSPRTPLASAVPAACGSPRLVPPLDSSAPFEEPGGPASVTATSARSCPAQNPRPAPVTRSARIAWSLSTRASACDTSSCIAAVKLLSRSGRLSVRRATPSSATSNRIVCQVIVFSSRRRASYTRQGASSRRIRGGQRGERSSGRVPGAARRLFHHSTIPLSPAVPGLRAASGAGMGWSSFIRPQHPWRRRSHRARVAALPRRRGLASLPRRADRLLDAQGQWRSGAGVEHEDSKLLLLLSPLRGKRANSGIERGGS